MKARLLILFLVHLIVSLESPAAVVQTNAPPALHIVTLREGVDVDSLIKELGLRSTVIYRHALNGFAVALDTNQIAQLQADNRIMAVESDGQMQLCSQEIPVNIARLSLTNFPIAHIDGGDHRINVDVAVLDTGIQTNHPDLNVVQWVGSVQGGNGDDWLGHGTEVAGVIGALDNDIGVVGVAPGVRLWSVQVFPPGVGSAPISTILGGLDFIAANADKIAVVNASLGGQFAAPLALHQAIVSLVNKGVVFVAGAGNNGQDIAGPDGIYGTLDDFLPAAFPEVMTVSATYSGYFDIFWERSNFSGVPHSPGFVSSPGAGIDVAAPGVSIQTTAINSGYASNDGTSFAAPHVTGMVALYIAANGRATNAAGVYRIRQAIIDNGLPQSAWDSGGNTWDPDNYHEPLAIASENWIPQPAITNASLTPQGFLLKFPAVPGYTYTVQSSDSVNSTNQWTGLSSTNVDGAVMGVEVNDPSASSNRFYRLLRQPAP